MGCLLRLPLDRRPLYVHPGVVLVVGYASLSVLSVVPAISGHPAAWMTDAAAEVSSVVTAVGIFIVAGYLFRSVSPVPFLTVALGGAVVVAVLGLLAYWKVRRHSMLDGLLSPVAIAPQPASRPPTTSASSWHRLCFLR